MVLVCGLLLNEGCSKDERIGAARRLKTRASCSPDIFARAAVLVCEGVDRSEVSVGRLPSSQRKSSSRARDQRRKREERLCPRHVPVVAIAPNTGLRHWLTKRWSKFISGRALNAASCSRMVWAIEGACRMACRPQENYWGQPILAAAAVTRTDQASLTFCARPLRVAHPLSASPSSFCRRAR
jgi:hypothetical protein